MKAADTQEPWAGDCFLRGCMRPVEYRCNLADRCRHRSLRYRPLKMHLHELLCDSNARVIRCDLVVERLKYPGNRLLFSRLRNGQAEVAHIVSVQHRLNASRIESC